ncbi:WD repeat-containing protein 35-like [Macrosteles quadrilineatus]|uniref:WD repeat-containing protein 35-like n=1 Tax=Macrosteles quadrilineatus TaxID=74068 RepID=UPI0023E0E453|nr:WD repeat-containing protein 35-like [Macrosteles quadrilineatus]
MFIYLSKKIAIPNNTKINCLAWSSEQGWIGVGGDDGLLKVLKLDPGKDGKVKGLAAPANLSMNQTLEGHSGKVQVITWNENHQKLTTSDQSGLIIVWMLYKGSWYEEMINNRNKSVVKGMAWNSDGQKICIVYEDGAVIVGSVDGNRIWGKELKGTALTGVQWSPDGKLLLFSLRDGEVHAYDNQGNFGMKVNIQCLGNTGTGQVWVKSATVVGMAWYDGHNGYVDEDCPCLVICYHSGHLQIMRSENDDSPVILDTGISAVGCSWNHNGSALAVTGSMVLTGETKSCNVVQFFTPFGEHLRTLKIPGREVTCCVWEGSSLRVALAVDSFIYFANIRPSYKWCYFSNTVVYSYNRHDRPGVHLTFWNTNNAECYSKAVKSLLGVAACKDHCVLAIKAEDASAQYGLILCNAIATPVDSKYMELEPLFVAINSSHVFAASRDNFLLWHYITPKSHSTLGNAGTRHRKERLYHIDDTPSGVAEVIQDLDHTFQPTISTQATADPICCLAVSEKVLLIGRESGTIQRYSLPQVALVQRYNQPCRPHTVSINCDSSMASVIDATGVLTLLELEPGSAPPGTLERKDVWAMVWASDNPQLLAIMEKTRMYVLRGVDPEEPIPSVGYICSFQDLEIRAVLLDEVIQCKGQPTREQHLLDLEVKSLRDTRQLLDKVGIPETISFIEENPHPRLWRLLAEAAVRKLDLTTAEAAFVRCSDYAGIQLVKRIANVTSDHLKRAQVAAYFSEFDEAERLYLEADRRDLAVALRERLGDWFQMMQLVNTSLPGTSVHTTAQVQSAWNNIGDYFADRSQWENAREYYQKAANTEKLIQCYQQLEDFHALEKTVADLPEKHPLLPRIAEIFVTMGMCQEAVSTYVKSGSIQQAVEASVTLNQWDQAVALAEKHNMLADIGRLLDKYASSLMDHGTSLEVVQLYRKAGRYLDAAKLMYQVAEEEGQKRAKPLKMKKLYVLAALLVEEFNSQRQNVLGSVGGKSSALFGDTDASADMRILDSAWRGAEAYHFLMLAHRQLYTGNADAAMLTALNLKNYEDILNTEDIFCLLACASAACKAFGTCSRAFMKLESLESVSESKREEYADLALEIFTKYVTEDSHTSNNMCASCNTTVPLWSGLCPSCGVRYPACVASGRPISSLGEAWSCPSCHHSALYHEMDQRDVCPLCHSCSSTHL